jgi:haloalkane dehalogenase
MIVMKPTIRALMAALALSALPMTTLAEGGAVLRTPDARFADLPDYPFEPRYLEVPFGGRKVRMHYIDVGPRTGPVVLLLHGQPSWSYMYRHLIRALSEQGYRTIAPDLIGFGRSDKPASMEDYTYARHLEALGALVGTLDLRDIDLVAHDWGGLLGMPTVAAMPERFNRLVDRVAADGTDRRGG